MEELARRGWNGAVAETVILPVHPCTRKALVDPIGFRGPGFSLSQTTIDVLCRRGYLYDCSTLPTYIGPPARLYYFMTTRLSAQQKEQRDNLFGTVKDGLRPIRPYFWRTSDTEASSTPDQQLIEIPVTTMPLFKIPIHVSYVIYLGTYSRTLALLLWRLAGTHPSLLLHPLDFLGADDIAQLSFFPAMNMRKDAKLKLVSDVLQVYGAHYQVVTMQQHASAVAAAAELPALAFSRRSGPMSVCCSYQIASRL